jgi:hypothetical protein
MVIHPKKIQLMNLFSKRPIISVSFIFIITLIAIGYYSYSDLRIEIFGLELKKADSKKLFVNSADEIVNDTSFIINQISDTITSEINRQTDSSGQRILLIGDSMVEGLMLPFQDYCNENGHKLFPVIWYSSSTKAFGTSDTLKYFIKKYNATYIIMALGSNELFIKGIKERDIFVKKILEQADTLKIVWIGPPNWKPDTGINDLISNRLGNNRYFLSKNLMFDRASDGAHPTRYSCRIWTDKIVQWITEESRYPIVLNKPEKKSNRLPEAIRMSL